MRKLIFILLTVCMFCLLCKKSENMPGDSRNFMNEIVLNRGEGNLLADQWLCERIYNSDLSQTRVLQTAEARLAVSMFQRGGQVRLRAAFLSMCCVTYGISGVAGLVARVHRKGFAAGLHAVDYYVYRLRRLII
ncbi:hypothetical protein [Alistipes shahii]|uniref:hypothetical protein n=1 Tax=Alistipes shahii TaxID=328814 RepID=UPI003FD7D8C8